MCLICDKTNLTKSNLTFSIVVLSVITFQQLHSVTLHREWTLGLLFRIKALIIITQNVTGSEIA